MYTFENICKEDTTLSLGDETTKIFVNPHGNKDGLSEELKNFLKYLSDGICEDEFTNAIEREIIKVKSNEDWRTEYMLLYLKEQEIFSEAHEQGLEQGINGMISLLKETGKTIDEIESSVLKYYPDVDKELIQRCLLNSLKRD